MFFREIIISKIISKVKVVVIWAKNEKKKKKI